MFHVRMTAFVLGPVLRLLDWLTPVADLLARVWVAQIFFFSGLGKIHSWPTTLMLFHTQYMVPLLSPTTSAYVGTGLELVLPVLLVLGLGGRLSIFIFFLYNVMCVISYHFLWTPSGSAGLYDHIEWGLLLLLLMVHGPGKLSLDYLIHRRHGDLLESNA